MELTEIAVAASGGVVISLMVVERIASGRGIGARFIQLATVVLVVSLSALLSLKGVLSGQVVAGIFGAALGYSFGRLERQNDA